MSAGLAALALLLASTQEPMPARQDGQDWTGNTMLRWCTAGNGEPYRILCDGYVEGVADGIRVAEIYHHVPHAICIPNGVDLGQMVDVFVHYLRDHPEERHHPAYAIVTASLLTAWHCERPAQN